MVVSGLSVNAQSLKDALYGGKLRLDTGAVIRKSDDLSTKIDTSARKPVVQEASKPEPGKLIVKADGSITVEGAENTPQEVVPVTGVMPDGTVVTRLGDSTTAVAPAGVKDNNSVWKEYVDGLTKTIREEVMPNKKIKSGDYSILIDYVINLDGSISVNSVTSFPESSYLDEQVKERLTLSAPKLTPMLNSYGKPRKAPKKQTITVSK